MLKKLRIALACIFFAGITLLFVGIGHEWWGWMAALQVFPSFLELNFLISGGIILLTLLLGRLYCSVICPMGVFQDSIIWLREHLDRKHHFRYVRELKWLRYSIFALFIAALVLNAQVLASLIAPYSAYGRMVRSVVESAGGVAIPALVITGAATLIVIVLCAWFGGRIYCNAICPVGTFLSLFSRFSLLRIKIDETKCVGCHSCERKCRAQCIDSANLSIDHSRCIDCFNCIGNCKKGAISFGMRRTKTSENGTVDVSRRKFIASGVILATGTALNAQETQGGLMPLVDKTTPARARRILPPGASNRFYDKCTACQLCVSACPNGVIRPSKGIKHLLTPELDYGKGFCRPECTACGDVCPTGALTVIEPEDKTSIKIGTAKVNPELCISCAHCAVKCPSGAIRMVKSKDGDKKVPGINEELCIGCGACEYLCPVRPISAITVDGIEHQRRRN